jgi:hypothetical protein
VLKKNTKLKMPDPVGRFQKFIGRKKNAIKFHYIEQFEKCFLKCKRMYVLRNI